jgi:hypothetical protein
MTVSAIKYRLCFTGDMMMPYYVFGHRMQAYANLVPDGFWLRFPLVLMEMVGL